MYVYYLKIQYFDIFWERIQKNGNDVATLDLEILRIKTISTKHSIVFIVVFIAILMFAIVLRRWGSGGWVGKTILTWHVVQA